ncbi:hypothetical protein [Klebsiella aerogenes]|uniref:hypothetical protein n=1 Tax=Klebsiella aerogenes TaxID=548 RepID=UPI0037BCBE74
MAAHITSFIVSDTAEGYFAAHLDNGFVRVGLIGCDAFDINPKNVEQHARAAALTVDSIEEMHDELVGQYGTPSRIC